MPTGKEQTKHSGEMVRAMGSTLIAAETLRRTLVRVVESSVEPDWAEPDVASAWSPSTSGDVRDWVAYARELLEISDRVFVAAPDVLLAGLSQDRVEFLMPDGVRVAATPRFLDNFVSRIEHHDRRGTLLIEH